MSEKCGGNELLSEEESALRNLEMARESCIKAGQPGRAEEIGKIIRETKQLLRKHREGTGR